MKSKISTKFNRLLSLFYFFSSFSILFSISPIQTCSKIMKFFQYFIGRVRDFANDFWKILKVLFKKIIICEIFFFSKFCGFLFVFLFFYYFRHFNVVYLYLSKNSINFYVFYSMDWRFYQRIWKIMEYFSKNIDIWNPKFFINFIIYYLFFLFFYHFGNVFFLYHLSELVK